LSDLDLRQLTFNQSLLGDLSVQANTSPLNDLVDIKSQLSGNNQLNLAGNYDIAAERLAVDLKAQRIELAWLEPFMAGELSDLEGAVGADLRIQGPASAPAIRGKVNFDQAGAQITYLNTFYRFEKETIELEPQRIRFPGFTFTDSVGRKAVLNGEIRHKNFDDFRLNLKLSSDEFLVLNTRANPQSEDFFYGKVLVGLQTSITGSLDDIKAEVQARTLAGTDLTILTPESEAELVREDYITYVTPEHFAAKTGLGDTTVEAVPAYQADASTIDLNVNLEIHPESKFTYVLDPLTGDQVEIKGDAQLALGVNPDGDVNLLGVFEVTEGTYNFSYESLVTKKFSVEPGSRILFNGDPYQAELDLTAVYGTRTSTYDLIRNELADPNGPVAEAAKRRSLVEVLLQMKGELFEPRLSFDLRLPASEGQSLTESSINRKLAQLRQNPSELNKQVFGLILLGSFVNTGASAGSGTGLEGIAVSSVSGFLNDQLNSLADRYVSGVQVDINLDSYKSEFDDQNTISELQVGLSRQLFNERLTVSVGTELGLESSSYTNSSDTELTQLTGNFVLRYRLTEDGRYNLRVFRRTDSDSPLGGSGNTR
ncbi:MAG: translocation/assembly module TamB domain-containing protein, partial [Bacteroidota bacterium]